MRLALGLICALVAAAPASASELMVVGRTDVLVAPRAASEKSARIKVEGRRCRLPGRTALAALARTSLKLSVRDYGACGPRAADATGLYVRAVDGERERGADGWVYKLDDEAPSIGAADAGGRFGARTRVLWFWCDSGPTGCQRTLSATPERRSASPGETLAVRVRAYDDHGAGVAGAGARVTLGSASAVADAQGVARLEVPARTGTLDVVATQSGRVRSFAVQVTIR
jgi:hypothetical protein